MVEIADHWNRDTLTIDKAAMYLIAEDSKRIFIRHIYASVSNGDVLVVYRSTADKPTTHEALHRLWKKYTDGGEA